MLCIYQVLFFLICQGYTSSKDCLVLLVDATERMFHTSGENEDTPFELSLKVGVVHLCHKKCISKRKSTQKPSRGGDSYVELGWGGRGGHSKVISHVSTD